MLNLLQLSPLSLASIQVWTLWDFLGSLVGKIEGETTQAVWYSVITILAFLACMVGSYFIGSINPSIILSKKLYGDDVRAHGSGNAGTTNMTRTYGKKMGILIFALDFSKAAIAVILGSVIARVSLGGAVAALFVVLGHTFPVFYKFKGGKGVACTAACILLLSPISFLFLFPIFALIVLFSKYISLGSIVTALLFPLFASVFPSPLAPNGGLIPLVACVLALLILFMHRENIKRLMEGKENKFYLFKKKAVAEGVDSATEDSKKNSKKKAKADEVSEKAYSDDDFVKCACGRIIPKTREKCVYCGSKNPVYVNSASENKCKKKKK